MRKPLLAAPVAAMLTLAATTSTLIQIVARSSPRLPRYSGATWRLLHLSRALFLVLAAAAAVLVGASIAVLLREPMESAPKPHHLEAHRLDRLTRLCRAAGVDPAIGLAGDLLPFNKGVLLLIGRTREGRRMWIERAGMALDPSADPPVVEAPAELRQRIGLIGSPVALDRHGIKELWLIESALNAAAMLERMLIET